MIESEIQKYLDKSAIKELLARYAICVDTGDADGFAELFTPDCCWDWAAAGLVFNGRDALRKVAIAVHHYTPGTQHAISNSIIEICGNRVTSTCQFNCFLSTTQQIYCLMLGFYSDKLIKEGNSWLIEERQVRVEHPELLSQGRVGELFTPLAKELLSIAQSSAS